MSWYHQTGDERGFADEGSPATMTIMPLQLSIPPQGHRVESRSRLGGGDGFCVNIQTEISSTIAHDRLLRCGSAFGVFHQARA
jgi:hypothetical protein